ncbi:MAG: hypothetical protein R3C03_17160 [Pirellulaceae bacterium]
MPCQISTCTRPCVQTLWELCRTFVVLITITLTAETVNAQTAMQSRLDHLKKVDPGILERIEVFKLNFFGELDYEIPLDYGRRSKSEAVLWGNEDPEGQLTEIFGDIWAVNRSDSKQSIRVLYCVDKDLQRFDVDADFDLAPGENKQLIKFDKQKQKACLVAYCILPDVERVLTSTFIDKGRLEIKIGPPPEVQIPRQLRQCIDELFIPSTSSGLEEFSELALSAYELDRINRECLRQIKFREEDILNVGRTSECGCSWINRI